MLIVSDLINNKTQIVESLKKRNKDFSKEIDLVIDFDKKRRTTQSELDQILSQQNQLSKRIGEYYKSGDQSSGNELKKQVEALKPKVKKLEKNLNEIKSELFNSLNNIPNVPHHSVKEGKGEEDNEIIYQSTDTNKLTNKQKPHWEIASDYNLISFELGNKISGAGFPAYIDKGAKLERSLINFFLDYNIKNDYTEVQPPILINESSGHGTGQLPDKEGQMYKVENENLYLIPTAEVPITNFYRNTTLDKDSVPIKLTGYTPCFRREAGSYGSDVRGLNRLHQFDKVEIVRIEDPSNSYKVLDEMVEHVKNLLIMLELPFRIVRLCGGDLGFTSALTYDFEVYAMGQNKWLEVSSVSNFESFQSNRLNLKIDFGDKKKYCAHTLNGSSLALPRIVACILENFQEKDHIKIPEILHKYTGFKQIN